MEVRYMDKLSDKRTIAQKFGDKGFQDKKLKENQNYKHITKVVDTGSTINKKQFMSDQLISKRKNELFKRLKGSTIIKLIKAAQANQTESIYNLGNDPNMQITNENKDDDKSIASHQTSKSNMTNVTAVTYATEMLGNLSEIDYLILDLREECDYERIHIKDALNFPGYNISRDKFTHQMIMMKNKPGKMIILYHNDERNGIPYANNFYQKGYDNIYFLSGGIEEFAKNFPDYLEGPEKEKYVNMKIERDKQAKLVEQKKNTKKYSIQSMSKNEDKNITTLKKNLGRK